MASTLRTLAFSCVCKLQQTKLEEWYKTYYVNSSDVNLDVCCELLKTNAKIQGQLLTILNETAREGDRNDNGRSNTSQYLPPWGSSFIHSSSVDESRYSPLRGSPDKEPVVRRLFTMDDSDFQSLQPIPDLDSSTRPEPNTTDISGGSIGTLRCSMLSSSPLLTSSLLPDSSRRNLLISRFIFLFANHRLDAQNLLRNIVDDIEMVQRIIFIATLESFHAAKVAFIHLKLHIIQYLQATHADPQTLETAIIDHITSHEDFYDVEASVKEVIGIMNLNEKISSSKVDFTLLSTYSREVCKIAFAMQTLKEPLEIAFAFEGETFNEKKYRRSHDSDFTSSRISYHVWPALMENNKVMVKGEAVTRNSAQSNRRTRKRTTVSRNRSASLPKRSRPSSR